MCPLSTVKCIRLVFTKAYNEQLFQIGSKPLDMQQGMFTKGAEQS